MTSPEPGTIGLNLLHSAFGSSSVAASVNGLPWRTVISLDHNLKIAEIAERGGLDNILIADSPGFATAKVDRVFSVFEPLTLLSAIAAHTEHIGIIPTISTSFNEPYNIARQIASTLRSVARRSCSSGT